MSPPVWVPGCQGAEEPKWGPLVRKVRPGQKLGQGLGLGSLDPHPGCCRWSSVIPLRAAPPCPALPDTYPSGTGSGPASAPCPGSSSSAGTPPSSGCMTSSRAALPSSLLLRLPLLQRRLRGENPPLGFIVSFRGQRRPGRRGGRAPGRAPSGVIRPRCPNTSGSARSAVPCYQIRCPPPLPWARQGRPPLLGCPWP